jgi:hypothetical protein
MQCFKTFLASRYQQAQTWLTSACNSSTATCLASKLPAACTLINIIIMWKMHADLLLLQQVYLLRHGAKVAVLGQELLGGGVRVI